MRYFFDTEFIEDGHTIELISLGMVDERGCALYLCNLDCDLSRANPWVQQHVLPHLPPVPALSPCSPPSHFTEQAVDGLRVWGGWGTRACIRDALLAFVNTDPDPEFWAYYADYDWVALCQLFGCMIELPERWPKFCLDLKQLAHMQGNPKLPEQTSGEHDALQDALWNRQVFAFLKGERYSSGK